MRHLILLFILIPVITFSQKKEGFSGKLVYTISICDTNLAKFIPPKQMVIYTDDTLLRIENQTDQLGKQVIIKHMVLNKSYLLLDLPVGSYAVQTDHNVEKQDSFPYTYKKRWGKREICGLKANRLKVSHDIFPEPLEFLYIKKYSNKYINTFENFPGLPVRYYIATVDGIFLYELTSIEITKPDHDLFGIPSNYKRVTFDQFMDELFKMQEQPEGPQEK
jgi:hypothetical protein